MTVNTQSIRAASARVWLRMCRRTLGANLHWALLSTASLLWAFAVHAQALAYTVDNADQYNWNKPQQIESGYLISLSNESRSTVSLTSLATGAVTTVPVSLQGGGATFRVTGAAVLQSSQLAVTGYSTMAGKTRAFIALVDFNGNILWSVDLKQYAPHQLCAT